MHTIKFLKRKMGLFKAAYERANRHFYDILDIIDFKGFGENHPDILTLSNGDIIVTWEDVDIDLEDIIPYLNEDGVLSKDIWDRVITKLV